MVRLGFIGAGKAGCSLSRYLKSPRISISGFYSKTFEHAKQAADDTQSVAFSDFRQVVSASDMIFVTTPDSIISRVWQQIEQAAREEGQSLEGKIFCHCSGSLSSKVFEGAETFGAFPAALHPMQAISGRDTDLKGTFFTADGHERAVKALLILLEEKGNPVAVISPESKKKYHMAAAAASNLMVGLVQFAVDALTECGFTPDLALQMLEPLMKGNLENICQKGTIQALTGPVERGDLPTLQVHLSELSGEKREIYRLLSKQVLKIAQKKHAEQDYSALKTILEEQDQ
ncbi:MAG: DUF2520 domain-containing protein [Firmicutes bacterium]|nr:DUF2520 domain-containing protein [Bacillota bacterium]